VIILQQSNGWPGLLRSEGLQPGYAYESRIDPAGIGGLDLAAGDGVPIGVAISDNALACAGQICQIILRPDEAPLLPNTFPVRLPLYGEASPPGVFRAPTIVGPGFIGPGYYATLIGGEGTHRTALIVGWLSIPAP